MKWIRRLEECVDYIESSLKCEIDLDILCSISCLSRLYFPRLFEAVTDIPLSEYIRRRRMTLAARELLEGDKKVIDVAFDYGYSTPESFSRAFKSVHGVPPSALKSENPKVKSYPRLTFAISIRGDAAMDYKIIEKSAFDVLGLSLRTTDKDGKNFKEIPEFWQKICSDGTEDELCKFSAEDGIMYGICFDLEEDGYFKYAAGVPYAGGEKDNFEVMTIPAAKWAIFECIGPMPDAIQKVWKRIFSEWLPATEFEMASLPQIEMYYPGDSTKDDYRSEVWIPVK